MTRIQIRQIPTCDVVPKMTRLVSAIVAHAGPRTVAIHSLTRRSRFAIARFARWDGVHVRTLTSDSRDSPPPDDDAEWTDHSFARKSSAPRSALFLPYRPLLVVVDEPSRLGRVFERIRTRATALLYVCAPALRPALLAAKTCQDVRVRAGDDSTVLGWCVSEDPEHDRRCEQLLDELGGVPRDARGQPLERGEVRIWGRDCPPDLLAALHD